ncbi:MAG TPA: hypothetical protein VNA25_13015 [Phycisphaerae bacterium]|nr:hypothetical protein [Phycisphaerae bacterium]HUT58760.1 hypothetical protein [Phycisphaerae bacterium]
MTQEPDKWDQSADALKSLADGTSEDPEQAADPVEPPAEPADPADPADAMAALEAGMSASPESQPVELEGVSAVPLDDAARRRQTAGFERRTQKAHAHQFKVIMIPLLITVGVLLFVCGTILLATAPESDPTDPFAEPQDKLRVFRSWFPLAAFPVGAFLLFGAWYFHREISASKRT